jgi:hypothetical protein
MSDDKMASGRSQSDHIVGICGQIRPYVNWDDVMDVYGARTAIPLAFWVLLLVFLHGILDLLGAADAGKPC